MKSEHSILNFPNFLKHILKKQKQEQRLKVIFTGNNEKNKLLADIKLFEEEDSFDIYILDGTEIPPELKHINIMDTNLFIENCKEIKEETIKRFNNEIPFSSKVFGTIVIIIKDSEFSDTKRSINDFLSEHCVFFKKYK